MPGKKISDLDVYDDVNTDKSRRDLFEVSKNTGTYVSPTYATNGSRKISVEQLKETLFIKDINSYNQVTTGSPTFDKQAYNGIANAGTYTLPTSVGNYEILAIILESEINVTVNGLGTGISDLVFTKQNETAYLIDTTYGWYPLAINKEVNSSAFELLANKENTTLDTSSTKYPTNNLVKTYVDNLGNTLTSGLATKLTIANNLSDLTNTTQARDNLFLGATNDVTHNSITLSNTTVSTLPFLDSAKKIISATGALLGDWFQTLTADTTPVDADTIVINDSVNSFEAKKTTLLQFWTNYIKSKADSVYLLLTGGTLTGALNEASIITIASSTNVDIVNISGNTALITGTTTIGTFTAGTSGMIRRVVFGGSLTLTGNANIRLPNNANTITTTANDVATFVYSSTLSLWLCVSYSSATSLTITRIPLFGTTGKLVNSQIVDNGASIFFNTVSFKSIIASGRIVSNSNDNYSFQVGNENTNVFSYGIGSGNTGVLRTVNNIIMSLNDNGVAIGTSSVNASAQLDLQSTSKGFLPNRMTNAQRTSIASPAVGLMVYCTDTVEGLYVYKSTGWTFII